MLINITDFLKGSEWIDLKVKEWLKSEIFQNKKFQHQTLSFFFFFTLAVFIDIIASNENCAVSSSFLTVKFFFVFILSSFLRFFDFSASLIVNSSFFFFFGEVVGLDTAGNGAW